MNTRNRPTLPLSGRRHYNPADEHKTWNFLQHKSGPNDHVIYFCDSPNLKKCRFGKGFQRRSLDQICPNNEEKRIQEWDDAIKRRNKHHDSRNKHLATKINRNGNIIKAQTEQIARKIHRKAALIDPVLIREHHIRRKLSKNRFFDPLLSDRPRIKKIKPNQKRFSFDIQIGKKDHESQGVLDNFCGFGYE